MARRRQQDMAALEPVQSLWDVPEGWTWKRLVSLCSYIQRGKSPKYADNGIPVVNQKCIRWNEVLKEFRKYTVNNSIAPERYIHKNDILINSTGTGTIGRACLIKDNSLKGNVVDSHVTIVRTNEYLKPSFLYFFFMSSFFQKNIEKLQTGSTNQVELSKQAIETLSFPFPLALEEQRRIVDRIEELFSDLDKAEESLNNALRLCGQYRQSLLRDAVSGELSKEWRQANPPQESGAQLLQRILAERRKAWEAAELKRMEAQGKRPTNDNWKKKYKEPQAPDTEGLPDLPEGWCWATMDMLGEWFGGGTPSKENSSFWQGSIPWISSKEVKDAYIYDTEYHISEEAVKESATNMVKKSSIVIVTRSGILKHTFPASILKIDATINQDIKAVELCSVINNEYILKYIEAKNKKILQDCCKDGTTVQSIEYNRFKKFHIPIPPYDEQIFIAHFLNNIFETFQDDQITAERLLRTLSVLRQSILNHAFTGKL